MNGLRPLLAVVHGGRDPQVVMVVTMKEAWGGEGGRAGSAMEPRATMSSTVTSIVGSVGYRTKLIKLYLLFFVNCIYIFGHSARLSRFLQ